MKVDFLNPKIAFINPDLQHRFRVVSRIFAAQILLVGMISYIGWFGDIISLTSVIPNQPQIRFLTATIFVIGGFALLITTYEKKRITSVIKDISAFCITLSGFITLFEYFTNETTVITSNLQRAVGDTVGGMMPPTISVLFICAGFALLFMDKGKKTLYQFFVLVALIILIPSVLEHFYGIDFIYGFASHTKIALHVTIVYGLFLFGILFARPGQGFMAVLSSESAGGYLARRMLITGMMIPLLLGGVVYIGNKVGWYDGEFRFLLFVLTIIITFTYVIWRNAKAIHSLDIIRRESEQSVYRLAAIVESSDDAIVGRDMKGIITDWNRGAEELFGYTSDEIIGKPVWTLFPKKNNKELLKFNRFIRSGKQIKEYEAIRVTKSGIPLPVSITASPIKNSSGRVVGLSSINRDISERKQIERQRELFIGIASHELKTPVTSAKAYAQLLKRHFQKKKDKESLDFLIKMEGQLNKLTELIGYLLDVSTLQKGQIQLNMNILSVDQMLTETIDELQQTTTTHEIVKVGKINKSIIGDKSRLTQVFRNILSNAIKYSPNAKKVIVNCETLQKSIKISITDFGIGISKREQKKVFDPLYRSEGVKKDKYSGLGLGLYITREIIKKHGGHIALQSIVGKGSTVQIYLPIKNNKSK